MGETTPRWVKVQSESQIKVSPFSCLKVSFWVTELSLALIFDVVQTGHENQVAPRNRVTREREFASAETD